MKSLSFYELLSDSTQRFILLKDLFANKNPSFIKVNLIMNEL